MIQSSLHKIPTTPPRFQASAIKVFDEADGNTDMFVPGLGDHYEDLAADFLENWLVSDSQEAKPESVPVLETEQEQAPPAPLPKTDSPSEAQEPRFTKFAMDWNLTDH